MDWKPPNRDLAKMCLSWRIIPRIVAMVNNYSYFTHFDRWDNPILNGLTGVMISPVTISGMILQVSIYDTEQLVLFTVR